MLTNAQALLLKTEIQADATLNAQPDTGTGNQVIADALNLQAVPNFPVWRTEVPVGTIYNAIDWAAYTPLGAVTDAAVSSTLIGAQRQTQLMAIQTKQLNLQIALSRDRIDMSLANVRTGLRDCVIQVPAGTAGANTNPGGTNGNNVLNACTRLATRGEKVLVGTLNQTTGGVTASVIGFEGPLSSTDVNQARNAV